MTRALNAEWRASVAAELVRRGQVRTVESQIAAADSPASAPRRDFQVAWFGASPPSSVIELRRDVALDVARACGVPPALFVASASGQAARESWRQFVATSVSGLARRIEAQVYEQLGVEVAIDTGTLGGAAVQTRRCDRNRAKSDHQESIPGARDRLAKRVR